MKSKRRLKISVFIKDQDIPLLITNYIKYIPNQFIKEDKFVFPNVILDDRIKSHLLNNDCVIIKIEQLHEDNIYYMVYDEIYIEIYNYEVIIGAELWITGNWITNDLSYNIRYNQIEIDVFYLWQQNKKFDWFGLPVNSEIKKHYFSAPLHYTGISNVLLNKQKVYYIDLLLIKEERDFYYLFAIEFMGERGYMGYDDYTFADCLSILENNQENNFEGIELFFLHVDYLHPSLNEIYSKIKSCLKYTFIIHER